MLRSSLSPSHTQSWWSWRLALPTSKMVRYNHPRGILSDIPMTDSPLPPMLPVASTSLRAKWAVRLADSPRSRRQRVWSAAGQRMEGHKHHSHGMSPQSSQLLQHPQRLVKSIRVSALLKEIAPLSRSCCTSAWRTSSTLGPSSSCRRNCSACTPPPTGSVSSPASPSVRLAHGVALDSCRMWIMLALRRYLEKRY